MISYEEWKRKQKNLAEWRKESQKLNASANKIGPKPVLPNPQEQAIKLLKISDTSSVLDVGCGGGSSKQWLNCEWTGIDPYPPEGHDILVGMAESLPFSNKSFDYAICFASLFHFLDPAKAINEMFRVGKTVGIMTLVWEEETEVSAVHTHNITENQMEEWGSWSQRIVLDYVGANPCLLYVGEQCYE